jgi:hypothetical protein
MQMYFKPFLLILEKNTFGFNVMHVFVSVLREVLFQSELSSPQSEI